MTEAFDRNPSYHTVGAVGFAAAEGTGGVNVRRVELARLPSGL